ncbi:MAG: nuclear transport factor 2 family protein [Chitinophagaceae bacterium]|nr:nuclear transport factor 2 family protein [Chitinophagaceae bacterium]
MNNFLFFCISCILLVSCLGSGKDQPNSGAFAKMELLKADRDFSKMSEEKGMKAAFMEYLDSNGVLLRPNRLPIAGADAIDYLLQQNDTDYSLTWEPRSGAVARSGELGYTYGVYALRPSTKDTVIYGTYVSIWKKEKDGTWRYVLDSGNEGIGEMKDPGE